MNLLQVEITKSRLARTLETQNQRQGHCVGIEAEDDNSSTEFLQFQKNQFIDLQLILRDIATHYQSLGSNSVRYDINFIKSYLLPLLVNERNFEPTVIEKNNQLVSFKFGIVVLLDISNLLGSATNLDSFLKAYKTSETKRFFAYEWFNHPDKLNNKEHPLCEVFHNKLRNCNPLQKSI